MSVLDAKVTTIDEREEFPTYADVVTEQAQKETGLIAQDIYYDCPELRHLYLLPATQRPQKRSQPVATTHKTIRTTTAHNDIALTRGGVLAGEYIRPVCHISVKPPIAVPSVVSEGRQETM